MLLSCLKFHRNTLEKPFCRKKTKYEEKACFRLNQHAPTYQWPHAYVQLSFACLRRYILSQKQKSSSTIHILRKKNELSPDMGLEPMTLRLKVWCSTDWANRAAHTVNQVKSEASNDFYASTRQLWKVGNQLPNTSNMLWNFNLALSTKNDITKMQGLLLLLCSIFLFLFFRSVQQHRQTLVPSFILPYGCLVTSGHRVPTTCRTPFPSSVAFTH